MRLPGTSSAPQSSPVSAALSVSSMSRPRSGTLPTLTSVHPGGSSATIAVGTTRVEHLAEPAYPPDVAGRDWPPYGNGPAIGMMYGENPGGRFGREVSVK